MVVNSKHGKNINSNKKELGPPEEQVRENARNKLNNASVLKSVPFKARRKLRRLIAFSQTKEIVIKQECVSLMSLAAGGMDPPPNMIMDSGTMYHLSRVRNDFAKIADEKIRVSGISGSSFGYKGYLKPCELGMNIECIYYKDLPAQALLSVDKA